MPAMRRTILCSVTAFSLLGLVACLKDDGVTVGGDVQEVVEINAGMPKGEVVDQIHGKEVLLAVGAIIGVNGTPANGVGYLHVFEDGSTILSGQLNIALPQDGTFYQAWLKNEATGETVEAGRPQPSFGDVRHGLRLESKDDLRAFTKVVITLEKDDGDPSPGLVVAEGEMKARMRSM